MRIKRYAKKQLKRGIRFAKKRYIKKGGPNVKNIYKDVMMLKSLVNVEKKRFDVTSAGALTFGQTAGAGVAGYLAVAVTPTPGQGNQLSARNGNSIKLVSCCIDLYFNQSANAVNGSKIKWYLFLRKDNGVDTTPTVAATQLMEINPFSAVIDYHSSRDAEYFTAYSVVKSGIVSLTPDSLTGQIAFAQRKVPLKLNHHLKFNTDATTITTKNKFFMLFTMDTGDNVALTGGQVQYNIRWYYTDN